MKSKIMFYIDLCHTKNYFTQRILMSQTYNDMIKQFYGSVLYSYMYSEISKTVLH